MSRSSSADRGFFIVLEGIDGAGKTTIARRLVEYFKEKGFTAIYTYEPYDTLYVRALKQEYAAFRDAYLDGLTYAADRLVHYRSVIRPVLDKGGVVVCDRYYYSSVAYQAAQGAPPEWVLEINRYAPNPDLAIYLDVDPETGLSRRRGLGTRFPEYEEVGFLERVRSVYLWMVEKGLLSMVDARRSLEEVYRDILAIIEEKLGFRASLSS